MGSQVWFVREKRMHGFMPALYHGDRPSPKQPYGPRKVFEKDPERVDPLLAKRPLREIDDYFSKSGRVPGQG